MLCLYAENERYTKLTDFYFDEPVQHGGVLPGFLSCVPISRNQAPDIRMEQWASHRDPVTMQKQAVQ
jgi:hypothetical protein